MIVEELMDFEPAPLFVRLHHIIRADVRVYLKYEAYNPGGSVKFRPAVGLVRHLESSGALRPGGTIIDTTSGNMGIALSVVAKSRGYGFICVTDDKLTRHNRALMEAYGAALCILPQSTLRERFAYIEQRMRDDASLVWTRQFTNAMNPRTHEATTACDILASFERLDYLFAGTGTGGVLAGCQAAFARAGRDTRVMAVDAEGSAHFTSTPAPVRRLLPGIGATERSPFLNQTEPFDVTVVPESEAIAACRQVVQQTGWLLGASSGSVVAAIQRYQHHFHSGDIVVGVAADSGERYLDGVYHDGWCQTHFPDAQQRPSPPMAA